jgi:hypothetical protein
MRLRARHFHMTVKIHQRLGAGNRNLGRREGEEGHFNF